MDIWIIRNGEKTGPIHDYEIRHKIEDGELPATTPAWHEGLEAWRSLGEMDLFKREFHLLQHESSTPPALPEMPTSAEDPSPPVPVATVLGRRFWARWFDLNLFAGIWWISMWAAGRDIGSTLENPWIMILQYVPWFILEAFLIHRFGTTPGKWLMSFKVSNPDGENLSLAESTRRSARVLFMGVGFGWNLLLTLFCQVLSYFTAKRLGSPLWDYAGGHRVVPRPLSPLRVISLVFLFYGALQLQIIVVSPYLFQLASEKFPALKEELEKNPPWHLPKRS